MTTTIFAGPTLSPAEIRSVLGEVQIRGPAEHGDAYRAARSGSDVIAIIDGYFEHRLPVWHKEILWALAQSVRVYGAASMGALRAAELADYGMVGVGRIFEWFRDGVLEDDDEVAIVHEEAGSGFKQRSEALVNVRATMDRALTDSIVTRADAARVIAALKATPYPSRHLQTCLSHGGVVDEDTKARLLAWLGEGFVDQKRLDALALLDRIKADSARARGERPRFAFAHTEVWQDFLKRADEPADGAEPRSLGSVPPDDILEELQITQPQSFHELWSTAKARAVRALNDARDSMLDSTRDLLVTQLIQELRVRGLYGEVAQRAAHKSALLARAAAPTVRDAPDELLRAHFESLGRAVPLDLDGYTRALAFADVADFIVALARERWYRQRCAEASPANTV